MIYLTASNHNSRANNIGSHVRSFIFIDPINKNSAIFKIFY